MHNILLSINTFAFRQPMILVLVFYMSLGRLYLIGRVKLLYCIFIVFYKLFYKSIFLNHEKLFLVFDISHFKI